MRRLVGATRGKNWHAIAWIVLAGLCAAPRAVDAGCGEHVLVRGRIAHQQDSMGSALRVGESIEIERHAASAEPASSGSTPREKPVCRGPHCSKGQVPPAVPMSETEPTGDQWFLREGGRPVAPSPSTGWIAEQPTAPAIGCGLSILRPPR